MKQILQRCQRLYHHLDYLKSIAAWQSFKSTTSFRIYCFHCKQNISSTSFTGTSDPYRSIRHRVCWGQQLPYEGYIRAELKMMIGNDTIYECVILVVPDSTFNSHVPLLLGTNILQSVMDDLKKQHGELTG